MIFCDEIYATALLRHYEYMTVYRPHHMQEEDRKFYPGYND